MRILICSNGMPAADQAVQLGGMLAQRTGAETTLLGVAERREDEAALRQALEASGQAMQIHGSKLRIVVVAGEPVRQIRKESASGEYDLAVIGTEQKNRSGPYWRSRRTYEVIKAIAPPVFVAIGSSTELKKFLVCTGGKKFIAPAVRLAGTLAAAVGAEVTLLHVMAEPPALYAGFIAMEEDLNRLLESNSELGVNLSHQKADLERLGVNVTLRIRHGFVLEELFREVQQGGHDLIVAGSSPSTGLVRHYIMGDLTRSILNRASCPVLVARAEHASARPGFFKRLFASVGN
jgi:nucleotide-binding universal stress UspA family protein